MTCELKPTSESCAFCTKGKTVFLIRSETYTGRVCAAHLHALLGQEKEPKEEIPNGQPVGQ